MVVENGNVKVMLKGKALRLRIERRYHLTPAITDADYGPEAITSAISTSEEDLKYTCNKYILSLQVTAKQASELTRATVDQDPSLNSLWQ